MKEYKNIHSEQIKLLAIGNLVAFIVASNFGLSGFNMRGVKIN